MHAIMHAAGSPTGALVRLDAVTKVFRAGVTETHALRDIDLHVFRGEYVAIAGPSGCGKSTLLAILGLLDVPTSGAYHLGGTPVAALGPDERALARGRQIGFVFQSFNLIGDLTAYENVELPLTYRKMPEEERKGRAWDALERVGMADRMNHFPSQLSGGQQQRVAVARAIAGGPLLLLADEPTGNLDSATGDAVMALLADLHAEGTTIILVTHDPRYADQAGRTLHLLDGRIVREERSRSGARNTRRDMGVES
jgi:putative ABC transport system ATP-binding protein